MFMRRNSTKPMVILAIVTGLLFATLLAGQNRRSFWGSNPVNRVNNNNLIEISGTISDLIVEKQCTRLGGNTLLATIKTADKSYTVHLGSDSVLKQQGITLEKNSKLNLKIHPSFRNRPGQYVAVSITHSGKELKVLRGFARSNGYGRRGKGRKSGNGWHSRTRW